MEDLVTTDILLQFPTIVLIYPQYYLVVEALKIVWPRRTWIRMGIAMGACVLRLICGRMLWA